MESRKIGNEVLIRVLPVGQVLPQEIYSHIRDLPNKRTTRMVCLPELISRSTFGACFRSSSVPA